MNRFNRFRWVLFGFIFASVFISRPAWAQSLPLQHDGYLTFKGAPYSGDITLRFELYIDGAAAHSEKQRVSVTGGQYTAEIGQRAGAGDLANRLATAADVELAVSVISGGVEVPLKPKLAVDMPRSAAFSVPSSTQPNSIGSDQLQAGSVTRDKLAPGAVTRQALAPRIITNQYLQMVAITGDKVRTETLTGKHIRDDSITGFDIADGSLNEGHMASPFRSRTYRVSADLVVDGGETRAKRVYCNHASDVLLMGSCHSDLGNLRGTKHTSSPAERDSFYCRLENLRENRRLTTKIYATCLRQY